MQAQQILKAGPRELFPGGSAEIKNKFKKLAGQWHPDHCTDPQSSEVFQHILKCRDAALRGDEHVEAYTFRRAAPEEGESAEFKLAYMRARNFEMGKVLVSQTNVSYLVAKDNLGLAEQAQRQRWQFFDKKMEQEMSKYLPRPNRTIATTEGRLMVYRRESDQILLADLLDWEKGKVDPRHVMWMVSSLLNTCCYLEVTRTAHCALLPQYLLVSPDMHSVAITGPALYATPWGHRPKAVPSEVLDAYPLLRVKETKVEDSRLDLTLVRRMAMRALGHTNPALLARDSAVKQGLRDWICSPAPKSAVSDYVAWEKLRGNRTFTPYETTASEMYVALSA